MSVPEQDLARQWLWKSKPACAYAVAFVTVGVAKCPAEFSAGDVPEDAVPVGSPGLPGTVCHSLVAGHVIRQVWIVQPTETTPGQCTRVMSKRGTRNSAYVNSYVLVSLGAGEAFLRANRAAVPSAQAELGLAVSNGSERHWPTQAPDGKW